MEAPQAGSDVKYCPDCAEETEADAKVCRYCGLRFESSTPPEPNSGQRADTRRVGIVIGLIALGVGVLATTLLLAVVLGDNGGGESDELNSRDDAAVAAGTKLIKSALRDYHSIDNAIGIENASEEDLLDDDEKLREGLQQVIDAVADERATATVPSQDGLPLKSFLSQLAIKTARWNQDAASELRETRDGLS